MEALLISDQPLAQLRMRSMLRALDRNATLCEAQDMAQAMGMLCGDHRFGFIVLDLDTRGTRPLMNTALLRDLWPSLPLLVLSSKASESTLAQAVDLGAMGHLPKSADTASFVEAFTSVLAGRPFPSALKLAA
jgi:DNA-binding NarL/FixJ family response regulator